MKTFKQWREENVYQTPEEIHSVLLQAIRRISVLEPQMVSDSKDLLLKLQTVVNDKVSGF